jgi:hypothetical protein
MKKYFPNFNVKEFFVKKTKNLFLKFSNKSIEIDLKRNIKIRLFQIKTTKYLFNLMFRFPFPLS